MATQKITDIPTETEADEVVATFKAIGCDPVDKVKQSDGKWTVSVITCPGPKVRRSMPENISSIPTRISELV